MLIYLYYSYYVFEFEKGTVPYNFASHMTSAMSLQQQQQLNNHEIVLSFP